MNPILLTDYYKTEHFRQYPKGTTMIYSNLTARKSRVEGVNSIIFFGLQHFVKKYLLGKFKTEFFDKPWAEVEDEYKYAIHTDTEHIKALHDLQYLPIKIKALPEGARCPIRVPCMTIRNTEPEFFWLTNYLETLISCQLWQPITSATLAAEYWKILSKYAKETTGTDDGVQWQAHDFSMRGMSSVESAILSGMGHLTSFTGTDSIPAIYALRNSYKGEGLIGASVPATEHSVMCMGTKDDEVGTFSNLLDLYPAGILSVVSDTWDLWKVLTEYLPQLKEQILARDGKLVIRPDSGDPVKIITGWNDDEVYGNEHGDLFKTSTRNHDDLSKSILSDPIDESERKGVIELLWDVFGGKINDYGYKVLNPCVGAIYGDSINLDRADSICKRLKAKGFASTNVVLGVGSYTYQYNTRDTFGFAVKATYGEVMEPFTEFHTVDMVKEELYRKSVGREIFKDPITDDGTKKSLKGLLYVGEYEGKIIVNDSVPWDIEGKGLLETVFEDGKLVKEQTLDDIRKRIKQ